MKSKLLCYEIKAHIIDEDDEGNTIGMTETNPAKFFNYDGFTKFAFEVNDAIERRTSQLQAHPVAAVMPAAHEQ